MIEYYGWINVSDSVYERDDLELNLILNKVSKFISVHEMEKAPGFITLHQVNGDNQLLVSGSTNHFSQDVADVIALYNYVAKIAQGSYGLLYIRNDESVDAFNEFEVFVLARGNVKNKKDSFLSPCIPVIEDDEK